MTGFATPPEPVLRQAAHLMGKGEFSQALGLLTRALAVWPDQPDLLQLLGTVHAQTGNVSEAETLYRRSLDLEPSQSHVAINLGHLLRRQGRDADALETYRLAVRMKSGDAEAHHALANFLHNNQKFSEAEQAYRDALRRAPTLVAAKIGLARTLIDQHKPEEAITLLTRSVADAADRSVLAAFEHHLGLAYATLGNHSEAMRHFDRALQYQPDYAPAHHGKGRALQSLGRDQEAIDSYRKAVTANPLNMAAHYDLNQLLYRFRRESEFLRSYDEASVRVPRVADFGMAKASFLVRTGKAAEALAFYDHVLRHDAGNIQVLMARANALVALRRIDAAIAAYELGLKTLPDNFAILLNLARAYLSAGQPRQAEHAANRALMVNPEDQSALATLSLAWRVLDDSRDQNLNDYDRFVQVQDIEPPGGRNVEDFHAALNHYLDGLHPDAREYLDQSLRGGTQTPDILNVPHPLIAELNVQIQDAVARYVENLPTRDDHPFLSRRTATTMFGGSWSSRLRDCGYHTNHIHPKGWISSVYYIGVPDVVHNSAAKEGWIKFGEPPEEIGLHEAPRLAIEPRVGRLVLFPSYMWHGTVPFRSLQSRTTIAFDLIPGP